MKKKDQVRQAAIAYRKRGLSYGEISSLVPVSKASLSLWLRDIKLTKKQTQRLMNIKEQGQLKGQMIRRSERIKSTQQIKTTAAFEIGSISKRELQLIGTALYWAEGSKQRLRSISGRVIFVNSDAMMIKTVLLWLHSCCNIPSDRITFSIYLHESAALRLDVIKKYWADIAGLPESHFQKVYWKKNKINTKRKNTGSDYFGLLRIVVTRSTDLNRKIAGWTEGIINNAGSSNGRTLAFGAT